MVQVTWTDAALADLDDIGDFIARNSPKYAEITVVNLFDSVDILENNPRAGVMTPEFEDESIRHLVRDNYRIVYHIVDNYRIDILSVHNCARLIQNTRAFKNK